MAGTLVVVGEAVRGGAHLEPTRRDVHGPGVVLARRRRRTGGGGERARGAPAGGSGASSRCADARGGSASPTRSRARSGGRTRRTGPPGPARPASARAPPPCTRSPPPGAGRGCHRARPAGSRWRRRPAPGPAAEAPARPRAGPATGPRRRRCGPGPTPAGSSAGRAPGPGPGSPRARQAPGCVRGPRPGHRGTCLCPAPRPLLGAMSVSYGVARRLPGGPTRVTEPRLQETKRPTAGVAVVRWARGSIEGGERRVPGAEQADGRGVGGVHRRARVRPFALSALVRDELDQPQLPAGHGEWRGGQGRRHHQRLADVPDPALDPPGRGDRAVHPGVDRHAPAQARMEAGRDHDDRRRRRLRAGAVQRQ